MTVTTFGPDALLDMPAYRGQRQASFRFLLWDNTSRSVLRELHPYKDANPTLTHNTTRTIPRQISNLFFDKRDTADLNVISNRLKLQMVFPGRTPYNLGTYQFLDRSRYTSSAGVESTTTAADSMFIVDQQRTSSYTAGKYSNDGTLVSFHQVDQSIAEVLKGIPIGYLSEPSNYYSLGAWAAGAQTGGILNDLAVDGDYFAPWFDHTDTLRFIRSFDPATKIPDFDYDANPCIFKDTIVKTDDLISAPNQFVVISNGSVSNNSAAVTGIYDIPSSAPHSALNRGFTVPQVFDWQVDTSTQANAIAFNIAQRQTIFERISFSIAPDPRHDSYNVFKFDGANWLELSWSLPLMEGSNMEITARKAYV